MADISGSSATTETISVGSTATSTLEVKGDHDWFKISLTAGQEITITLTGLTLEDPYLRIRDSAGNVIFENDDVSLGLIRDSKLSFVAPSSGTFYIDVGAWNEDYTGSYELSVQPYSPPPVWSLDQVANFLVSGYWVGDDHKFNVSQGGSITVNITALTVAGQNLAREALALWSDIIGVNFTEVTTGGQITFDDNEDGAHADGIWSNGITSSAHVNVSAKWLNDYGTSLNSYSFQTYLHEIGHALGLGHAGHYNGSANYRYDAQFLNDGWPTTVMSYFDQNDSDYFDDQGFTKAFVVTPMLADVVAMSMLYGLSTTTRTGDTTYGFNSNAGRAVFDANQYPTVAYTVFDSGGNDTLDYSGFEAGSLINLNAGTFSDVGGRTGNVAIAPGVLIENAIGGNGGDRIIGNAANNVIDGRGNIDTVSYETATAGVTVNLLSTAAQDTGGAGTDRLLNVENLTGSSFADVLTGRGLGTVDGGAGDDVLRGSGGDTLKGGAGDDRFISLSGYNIMEGGDGWDIVDFSSAKSGVQIDLSMQGPNDAQTYGIEEAIGSAYADTITGDGRTNTLSGLGGNDELHGLAGHDRLDGGAGADKMYGGTGNDSYYADASGDTAVELADEGNDHVYSTVTFALSANIERLTLLGAVAINATGNDLGNVIEGNSAANALYGLAGADTLIGNAGNDRLNGGLGNDRMYGGVGHDSYYIDSSRDYAVELAGEGTDHVFSSVSYTLRANLERLTLTGTTAVVGAGNELNNLINGNSASNRLYGLDGADVVRGGAGNDRIDGGTGADKMYGGTGRDTFIVDASRDAVYENAGEGVDIVYASVGYALRANVENLTLTGTANIMGRGNDLANVIIGNVGANTVYGYAADDRLYGVDGNDRLFGGLGNDRLDGGNGHDALYGEDGADLIYGRDGNDVIYGGAGRDTMFGGPGSDKFVFDDGHFGGATPRTADFIRDFSQSEGDILNLRLVDADVNVTGDQAFAFIGTAAFSGTAGELRYQQGSSNTFIYGDTDGDGAADFAIRLAGLHTLTSTDFVF